MFQNDKIFLFPSLFWVVPNLIYFIYFYLSPSVLMSAYLCLSVLCLSVSLFVCLSLPLSVSLCLSLPLSAFLSLSVNLSVCQSLCLSISLSVNLSVCQSVCCQSLGLSVYLCLSAFICPSDQFSAKYGKSTFVSFFPLAISNQAFWLGRTGLVGNIPDFNGQAVVPGMNLPEIILENLSFISLSVSLFVSVYLSICSECKRMYRS